MDDTFMWLQDSSNSHQHQQEYPRKTGEWKFSLPANYHKKRVAVEYLKCVSCGDCRIKLRLKYNAQKCVIQSNANCHSLLPFKKEIKIYQPVPQQIKKEIIEMRNFSLIKMKPAHVYANLVGKYPQALVPAQSKINDIIEYDEKVSRNKMPINLTEFMQHPNFVFHESFKNDFIIIFNSNPICFELFQQAVQDDRRQVGLDAQFKNNKERFPLYLLCSQDSAYTTVPGYIIMLSKNNSQLLSKAIKQIKLHLLELKVDWKAHVMIDKCKIERKSLVENDLHFLLCEFHFLKEIEKFFRNFNDKASAYQKVKSIQRATNEKEL